MEREVVRRDPGAGGEDLAAPVDQLTFGGLFAIVWRGRATVMVSILACVFFALLFLHLVTYRYEAQLNLAPPPSSSPLSSIGQLSGGLGSLASLAGVGAGAGGGGLNYQLYRDALFDHSTAVVLAADPRLMQGVFPREWNAERRRWQRPDGFIPEIKFQFFALVGSPRKDWSPPDAGRLQDYIEENLAVVTSTKTPTIKLAFRHPDPEFAAYFLAKAHAAADAGLRRRLLQRTEANIAYLEARLATVSLAEHRLSLAQALSDQVKLRMTASVGVDFAAEQLGAPAASKFPVTPNPVAVLAVAFVFGLLLGAVLAMRSAFKDPGGAATQASKPTGTLSI